MYVVYMYVCMYGDDVNLAMEAARVENVCLYVCVCVCVCVWRYIDVCMYA